MLSEVVLATSNTHKIEEMTAIMAPSGIRLLTGRDFPNAPEPEETGTTYEENARIKALAWAQALGRAALADDSGLEVEALGGRPGVYSSRYAPTSPERIARLLGELEGIEMTRRGSAICLRRGDCLAGWPPAAAARRMPRPNCLRAFRGQWLWIRSHFLCGWLRWTHDGRTSLRRKKLSQPPRPRTGPNDRRPEKNPLMHIS